MRWRRGISRGLCDAEFCGQCAGVSGGGAVRYAQGLRGAARAGGGAVAGGCEIGCAVCFYQQAAHAAEGALFRRDGALWLMSKRLEEGTFAWSKADDVSAVKLALRPEAFAMLTDGIDLRGAKMRPWYGRA